MRQGAIIIIQPQESGSSNTDLPLAAGPSECVEIAGLSALERMIERFVAIEIPEIMVLVSAQRSVRLPSLRGKQPNVTVQITDDINSAFAAQMAHYADQDVWHSFVAYGSTYTETDLLDLGCFHREARQPLTPTYNAEGPVSLWVADCANFAADGAGTWSAVVHQRSKSKYFIREYTKHISSAFSLRQFASDILSRRCETAPCGKQVRPGVWLDKRADIDRRARIVAPAYVGRESKILADALITRLCNIEKNCFIDSGTVVEDSSILPYTRVGICLDICHSVVSGTKLVNLERNVVVDIEDPSILRSLSTAAARRAKPLEALIESARFSQSQPPAVSKSANPIEE